MTVHDQHTESIKLLDFGLVRELPEQGMQYLNVTPIGTVIGTPHYLSPEQASGKMEITIRSDFYSIAATAVHLLTGVPMYQRKTWIESVAAHLQEPTYNLRKHVPEIPNAACEVLQSCLEKDPQVRPSSAKEIANALTD